MVNMERELDMTKASELPDRMDRIIRVVKQVFQVPIAGIKLESVDHDWPEDIYYRNDTQDISSPSGRFYAGVILRAEEGQTLGVLSIEDVKSRDFSENEKLVLRDLGKWAELEVNVFALNTALESARLYAHRLQSMNSMMVDRELKMVELKKQLKMVKDQQKFDSTKGEGHA